MAELTAPTYSHLRIGCGRKGNGEREGEVSEGVSLVMIQPFAWEKKQFCFFLKSQKCPYHMTIDLDLDLEHILGAEKPGDHRLLVG